MKVVVQGFEGCPHWSLAADRVRDALGRVGIGDQDVELERVDGPVEAAAVGFHGSPTILIDGTDPFSDETTPGGFACRVYQTESGPQGAPSVGQLVAALRQ
jgi:hypothetical protein